MPHIVFVVLSENISRPRVQHAVLTFDKVHECDNLLGKRPSVHGGLLICAGVLQHGQEVQTLATNIDQI